MAIRAIVFNEKSTLPYTVESFYQSPSNGNGTKIVAFTASNDTGSSKYYRAYIYSDAGQLVSSVIPLTIVVKDRADNGPTIINQVIPAGGTLRLLSSEADSLNFYVTGNEQ
jgi:hypothetical protein